MIRFVETGSKVVSSPKSENLLIWTFVCRAQFIVVAIIVIRQRDTLVTIEQRNCIFTAIYPYEGRLFKPSHG